MEEMTSTVVQLNSTLYENSTRSAYDYDNTEFVEDIMKTAWFRTIFILLYSVIFIIGISGNALVSFVVIRNKSMQTITNLFITNLAISDIMMCLLAVPFTPLSAFMENWVFGEALCHLVPMSLAVSVYVSTLTSTAIAVDRFMVIVHPFKPRMKVCVCFSVIVTIWLIAVTISLPLGVYQKVIWIPEEGVVTCQEHWPKETARQFFTVTSLILQYIVPCSFITYCYVKVSFALGKRSRDRSRFGSRNRDRDEIEIRRKKRTNKMLIAMISIFMCCWLPLNVVHIISEYHEPFAKWKYFYLIFFFAHVIAMSSTVYNPFLYAWMNDNFRKEFRAVIPFKLVPSTPSMSYAERGSMYTAMDTQQTGLTVTPPNRTPPAERKDRDHLSPSNSQLSPTTDSAPISNNV